MEKGGLGEGLGGGEGEGEGGVRTAQSILRPKFPNAPASNPTTSILYSSPWTEGKTRVLEKPQELASSLKAISVPPQLSYTESLVSNTVFSSQVLTVTSPVQAAV